MTDSLQGLCPEIRNAAELAEAIEGAFSYRGDVTLRLRGGEELVGYVFNRRRQAEPPFVEVYPAVDDAAPRRVSFADIEGLEFTGRDTADGRSWEAWVAKNEAEGHED